MTPLQTQQLFECLREMDSAFCSHHLEIICLDQVDSTQRFLKDYPETSGWVLCTAEMQTQGRGRLGRQWYSAQPGQIYASIRFPAVPQQGLSLVVRLAMMKALSALFTGIYQHGIMLKWPNDLIWKGKKLAGILIEVSHHSLILGMGLNVLTTTYPGACALSEIFNEPIDRHVILANIIIQLKTYLSRFAQSGLGDFIAEWDQVDGLKGRPLTVRQGAVLLSGIACGINLQGELLLQDKVQQLHTIDSGEITLG